MPVLPSYRVSTRENNFREKKCNDIILCFIFFTYFIFSKLNNTEASESCEIELYTRNNIKQEQKRGENKQAQEKLSKMSF